MFQYFAFEDTKVYFEQASDIGNGLYSFCSTKVRLIETQYKYYPTDMDGEKYCPESPDEPSSV